MEFAMSPSRRFTFGLALLTVAGCALRFTRLGAQSFWIDEVISFAWIQEIRKNGLGSLLHDIHGPLHAFVLWCLSFAGTGEAWMRAPSAVASALAVPLLGWFTRALAGARAGIVAAALVALSPFALYYAQECRNYALTMGAAVLLLVAARGFVHRPGIGRAALLAASQLLAVACNLSAVFFAAGLQIWVLARLRRAPRRAWSMWAVAHVALALVLLPYAMQITRQVRPERMVGVETDLGGDAPLRGATTLHPMALPYAAYSFAAGYSLGPTLEELRLDPGAAMHARHAPGLFAIALGFGLPLVCGILRKHPDRGLLVLPAVATAGFTVWLAAANMKPFNVRYLAVVAPAFWIWTALGIVSLPRRYGHLVLAIALAVSAWSCWNYLFVPRYARDDVGGAARFVAAHAAPEDAIVQLSLTAALRWYYDDLGGRPVHPPALASDAVAAEFAAQASGQAPVTWYLECRPESLDPDGRLRRAFEAGSIASETTSFVGIRVHRYLNAFLQTAPADSASSP
jgi:hypothetical protein